MSTTEKRAKTKRLTTADKALVKRMKEIRELLSEFGIALSGYDPGVTGYFKDNRAKPVIGGDGNGFWGEPFSLNRATWNWLEPLLVDLKKKRESA